MRKLVVIALLAVCASVYATGGISGVVTDSATTLPIHYARASCRAESSVAYTDSTGCYLISSLPPGEYTVKVSATGYVGDTYPEPVVVVDSQVTPDIDFALVPLPPTGISGLVTDYESGEPIYHATLSGNGLPTKYSDSSGAYFIPANPGLYVLWAAHDGWLNGIYPESIQVEPGVVTDSIDFALISTTGKPGIGGGTIIASGQYGCDTATSIPTGGYVISGLALGKYQVTAFAEGFQTKVAPESVLVESGQVKWCPFYLQPDSTFFGGFAGMVTNTRDGLPLFGALVTATRAGHGYANTGTQGKYKVGNLVPVANGTVASSISPALYPMTAVAEPHAQAGILTSYLFATPNPARGAARVQWQVKEPGRVTLRVLDNAGRAVRTTQRGYQSAGLYSASWNGICDKGERAANGVLFYTLDAPGIHRVIKAR